METEVQPRPNENPASCILQLWVTVTVCPTPILAVCDGGAEVSLMSQRIYQQLDPKPELRPATEKTEGLCGPNHSPMSECSIKFEIPESSVAINYDFIVGGIEEDPLIDASMLHCAQIQLRYNTQELSRKGKVARGVARLRPREYRARRIIFKSDWVVQPRSLNLLPGCAANST